jgi:hypothetical protein
MAARNRDGLAIAIGSARALTRPSGTIAQGEIYKERFTQAGRIRGDVHKEGQEVQEEIQERIFTLLNLVTLLVQTPPCKPGGEGLLTDTVVVGGPGPHPIWIGTWRTTWNVNASVRF